MSVAVKVSSFISRETSAGIVGIVGGIIGHEGLESIIMLQLLKFSTTVHTACRNANNKDLVMKLHVCKQLKLYNFI